MKSDINLISSSQVEVVKGKQTVGILKIVAIACVLSVGILSVIFFIILQSLSPAGIKRQQDIVLVNIAALRPKEAKLLLIKEKIKDTQIIVSKRPKYDILYASIIEKIPEDTSVSTLSLDNQKLAISASSKSLNSLNGLIDNLLEMVKNGEIIKNLTIDNISVDSTSGNYSISLKADRI